MHHNAPHVTDRGNFVIIGQTANGWGSLNVYSVLSKNTVVSGCPAAAEFEFDCSCYTTELNDLQPKYELKKHSEKYKNPLL